MEIAKAIVKEICSFLPNTYCINSFRRASIGPSHYFFIIKSNDPIEISHCVYIQDDGNILIRYTNDVKYFCHMTEYDPKEIANFIKNNENNVRKKRKLLHNE